MRPQFLKNMVETHNSGKHQTRRVNKGLSTQKLDGEQGRGHAPVTRMKISPICFSYQVQGHGHFDLYKYA